MNKTYRVVINDFLAGGGDGFTAFKGTNQIAVIGADTEVFMSYIADQTNAGNLIKAPITDAKQSQEITFDNSAAPQLKIVNGQAQTAPVAVKSNEPKDSQAALPQTGNDEKSALVLLGTALIGMSGMFIIRRRPRRQK